MTHLTAPELAKFLTDVLRDGGDRKWLECHQDVLDAMRQAIPPSKPAAAAPADPYAAGVIGNTAALLTGIDFIAAEDCEPGQWRLVTGLLQPEGKTVLQAGTLLS